jgi:hypothetical protein
VCIIHGQYTELLSKRIFQYHRPMVQKCTPCCYLLHPLKLYWGIFTVMVSFLSVSIKDSVSYQDYVTLVTDEWVWGISGMILMEENWSTQTENCPSASFSNTSLTWIHHGTEPRLPPGEASDQLPEPCHGHNSVILLVKLNVCATWWLSSLPLQTAPVAHAYTVM